MAPLPPFTGDLARRPGDAVLEERGLRTGESARAPTTAIFFGVTARCVLTGDTERGGDLPLAFLEGATRRVCLGERGLLDRGDKVFRDRGVPRDECGDRGGCLAGRAAPREEAAGDLENCRSTNTARHVQKVA